MEKFKGEYKTLVNRYDKWEDQKIARIEKDLKAIRIDLIAGAINEDKLSKIQAIFN